MTNENLNKLEELAKNAPPGPWTLEGINPATIDPIYGRVGIRINARAGLFVAAATPAVILELIAEIRRLRQCCI